MLVVLVVGASLLGISVRGENCHIYWVSPVFSPVGTGENAYSDEVLQMGLDFWEVGCSNSGTGLRMHHERGAGQEAPSATHLTVSLRVVEL